MTKGRRPKEWDSACNWLAAAACGGVLIPVKYIEQSGPASMQTMHKARKTMGLECVNISGTWFWRYPLQRGDDGYKPKHDKLIHSKPVVPQIEHKAIEVMSPQEYDPLGYHVDTEEIIASAKQMTALGKSDEEIIQEMCLGAVTYPMPKPYSKEYIVSVVMHAVEGKPINYDLNLNENKA